MVPRGKRLLFVRYGFQSDRVSDTNQERQHVEGMEFYELIAIWYRIYSCSVRRCKRPQQMASRHYQQNGDLLATVCRLPLGEGGGQSSL